MMGVLSNKIDREQLRPGDHIYSWRKGYIYAHHGIYMGDGKVTHFTRGGEEIGTGTILDRFLVSSVPSNSDTNCEICGDQSTLNGVISSCIGCFLCGGDLYLFHYSVSPAFFIAKVRGGTCTLADADPMDDVLHRAEYLLLNGFGTYNIFKNNCEDFAIYCKTGLLVMTSYSVGRSGQLTTIIAAASAVVSSPLRFLTSSFGGLTVITSGIYCLNRVVSDIGIRRDVTKIRVENLVSRTSEDEPERTTEVGG
uniref:Lecithin retinol acyltransferase n=1 Tax=Anthurium amnicola TaxID=1678845 RepID=A0A1D1XYE5_9ARAE